MMLKYFFSLISWIQINKMTLWNYTEHDSFVQNKTNKCKIDKIIYLLVEIKKPFRTVDIVKRSKTSDSAINVHWMSS